jgi:hypothetical protein
MLGRLLGVPFPAAPRAENRRPEVPKSAATAGRARSDDQSEPAGDAALKRRIERQIRDSLGDRLRSVEVRVTGRNVLIVAKPSRFWQKRTIRRSLEELPALAGLRARVEIGD